MRGITHQLEAFKELCEDCPALRGEVALVQVLGMSLVDMCEDDLDSQRHFCDNEILKVEDTVVARVVIANAKNRMAQGKMDVQTFNSHFADSMGTCDMYTPEELNLYEVEVPACKAATIATKKFIEQKNRTEG